MFLGLFLVLASSTFPDTNPRRPWNLSPKRCIHWNIPAQSNKTVPLGTWFSNLTFNLKSLSEPGLVAHACSLRAREEETGRSLGLNGQPAMPPP